MNVLVQILRLTLSFLLLISFEARADGPVDPELHRLAARYLRLPPGDAYGAFDRLDAEERTIIENVHRVSREQAADLQRLWAHPTPALETDGERLTPAQKSAVYEYRSLVEEANEPLAAIRSATKFWRAALGAPALISYGARVHLVKKLPGLAIEGRLEQLANVFVQSLFAAAEAKAADKPELVETELQNAGRVLIEAYAVAGNVQGSYRHNRRHAVRVFAHGFSVLAWGNLAATLASFYVDALAPYQGALLISQIGLVIATTAYLVNQAFDARYDRRMWFKNSRKMRSLNAALVPKLIDGFWRDVGERVDRDGPFERVRPADPVLTDGLRVVRAMTDDATLWTTMVRSTVKRRFAELNEGRTMAAVCDRVLTMITPLED